MTIRIDGEVRVHVALPFFSGDQLAKNMYAARGPLSRFGVQVPRSSVYRDKITRHLRGNKGMPMMPRERENMWGDLGGVGFDTLFLSFTSLFAKMNTIVDKKGLLPDLFPNLHALRECLDGARIHLLLNTVNPGALMAHVIQKGGTGDSLSSEQALDRRPYWSDLVGNVRREMPDTDITVWASEDAPLVWPKVLRAAAGLDPKRGLPGALDMARAVMSPQGRNRMTAYLEKNPPKSEEKLIKVMAAFLDKFADQEKLEFTVDLPGWTREVFRDFEEIYDEDLEEVRGVPGVTLLDP